jgi:hypothetical protein
VRRWLLRHLLHHAAALFALGGEDLIFPDGAHIHRFSLRPTEQVRVERERAFRVAAVQLMPTNVARLRGILRRRLLAVAFEQQEASAARITRDSERADIGNLGRWPVDRPARGFDLVGVSLDVVDRDIAHPGRTHAHLGGVFGNWHQAADHRGAGLKQRIALVVHRVRGKRPANDLRIEFLGPGKIVRHLIVPDEFAEQS